MKTTKKPASAAKKISSKSGAVQAAAREALLRECERLARAIPHYGAIGTRDNGAAARPMARWTAWGGATGAQYGATEQDALLAVKKNLRKECHERIAECIDALYVSR